MRGVFGAGKATQGDRSISILVCVSWGRKQETGFTMWGQVVKDLVLPILHLAKHLPSLNFSRASHFKLIYTCVHPIIQGALQG